MHGERPGGKSGRTLSEAFSSCGAAKPKHRLQGRILNRGMSATNAMYFDPHLGLSGNARLRPTAVASVDTSFILDQAAARLGAPIHVVQTMGFGSIRHFAPTRVANELAWTYVAAARRRRVDSTRMYELLTEDFMPRIRFVDLPPVPLELDTRL